MIVQNFSSTIACKKNESMHICMRDFHSILLKAYQNEATAKQAIIEKNEQNFTLKINGTYTQTKTCYDRNY
jgi:hypothetical protein